jgi:NodT family efflux transporter outer membrane factor (OMF) lipoprotein
MSHRFSSTAIAVVLLMTGCAVGPDFKTPDPPAVQAYDPAGLPQPTASANAPAGDAQKFVPGEDIPAEWWKLFHSEPLNRLIAKALEANPDLQAAQASLREAQENLAAGKGAYFPSVDGSAGVTREKISEATLGQSGVTLPPFTLYNASVNVSYAPDVFGGTRREVEALEAQKEFQRFELEAARLTLTSNVATAAIQEASLRAQIATTRDILKTERRQLDLLNQQLSLGGVAKAAILAQAAIVAQTEAALPPLEKQLAQTRHALSALAGQFPSEELDATFNLSKLKLPESLPLTLPSQLVNQRPDVQAATAQMHAASAEIGVAIANMLPTFPLSASYGAEAGTLASLFSPASAIWSIGGNILQPIFHGGELLHKKRASEAAFDAAAAQYRSTVLGAFQNVADSLRALQSDAAALKAQVAADRAAADSLKLSRDQFNAGAISYLSLLTAEQTYQQTKLALVQAEAQRFADTAALFQALGGGWWKQPAAEVKNSSAGEPVVSENDQQKETVPAAQEKPAASKQAWQKTNSTSENNP